MVRYIAAVGRDVGLQQPLWETIVEHIKMKLLLWFNFVPHFMTARSDNCLTSARELHNRPGAQTHCWGSVATSQIFVCQSAFFLLIQLALHIFNDWCYSVCTSSVFGNKKASTSLFAHVGWRIKTFSQEHFWTFLDRSFNSMYSLSAVFPRYDKLWKCIKKNWALQWWFHRNVRYRSSEDL